MRTATASRVDAIWEQLNQRPALRTGADKRLSSQALISLSACSKAGSQSNKENSSASALIKRECTLSDYAGLQQHLQKHLNGLQGTSAGARIQALQHIQVLQPVTVCVT